MGAAAMRLIGNAERARSVRCREAANTPSLAWDRLMPDLQQAAERAQTRTRDEPRAGCAVAQATLGKAGAAGGYRTYDLSLTKGVLYH